MDACLCAAICVLEALGNDDGGADRLHGDGVLLLVIIPSVALRNEDRREALCGNLHDRAGARSRKHDVASSVGHFNSIEELLHDDPAALLFS